MKTKNIRHQMIREIIQNQRVRNQNDLARLLVERGINVTQATLSRDLRHLRVNKLSNPDGGYTYVLPADDGFTETAAEAPAGRLIDVVSIEFSDNLVVIKTRNGYATGLAYDIDMNHLEQFVGTIAGADTVFAVMREGVSRMQALAALQMVINPPKDGTTI